MPPKVDNTSTSTATAGTSASASAPLLSLTQETLAGVAGLLSSAVKSTISEVKIDPLRTNAPNRYVQTEWATQWLKRFKRLLQPLGPRSPEDKAAMLLTALGEEAALMFDAASDIVTTDDAYEQALKKIEKLFMVPNLQKEARIRFYSVAPDDEYEKPLTLLDKLRKAAVLCEFERPDQMIMRLLLNKCPDS